MDQMAVNFVSSRYPPTKFLKPDEFMVFGRDENQIRKEHDVEPEMARKDELINAVEDGGNRRSIVNGESEVRLVDPQWMRILSAEEVDIQMEPDGKEEEGVDGVEQSGGNVVADELAAMASSERESGDSLLLYSCVGNDHKTHLMAYQEDTASQPMMAMASDKQLFMTLNQTFPEWIKVDDLDEKCPDIAFHRICDLLFALWADGVVETKQHH